MSTNYYDKNILKNYNREDGRIDSLKRITFEITYRCNLKCKMCFLHGVNGIIDNNKIENKELTTEEYKKIFLNIRENYPDTPITITGGEPFLREDCLDLCEYLCDLGFTLAIVTNGTLIKEKDLERIAKLNIDYIAFSIDGTREVHDSIRGNGTFDSTFNTAIALREIRNDIQLYFNYTISSLNYKDMFNFVKFCNEYKFNVAFEHLWFSDEKLIKKHDTVVENLFGESHQKLSGFINSFNVIDINKLKDNISNTLLLERDIQVSFFPAVKFGELESYYHNLHGYVHRRECYYHWERVRINPYGEIVPCVGSSIGSIKEQCLVELINNEKYRYFRTILKNIGHFPNCARCCKL